MQQQWHAPIIEDLGKPKRQKVFSRASLSESQKHFTVAMNQADYDRMVYIAELEHCSIADLARQAIHHFVLQRLKQAENI